MNVAFSISGRDRDYRLVVDFVDKIIKHLSVGEYGTQIAFEVQANVVDGIATQKTFEGRELFFKYRWHNRIISIIMTITMINYHNYSN